MTMVSETPTLKEFTLEQAVNDPHTFVHHMTIKGERKMIIIPIYVDNLTIIGDKILTDDFEEWLPKEFNCTMVGDTSYLLGICINQNHKNGTLDLDQEQYVRSVLECFNAVRATPPLYS